jgi:hypothetical protein
LCNSEGAALKATPLSTNSTDHYIRSFGNFSAFGDSYKYKNMDKITPILENVVRCKYFEAGVSYQEPNEELISRWFR